MHREYGVSLVKLLRGKPERLSSMLRDYGVSLVGLLRGKARKIDEFYAQGLWGKFSWGY